MTNYLRLRTAYSLEELDFPTCFVRVEEALAEKNFGLEYLLSEGVNVARRMGDVDLFALHIEQASVPADVQRACPLVSAYLAAYFGSCKALFDAVAIFLNSLYQLHLPWKKRDFRLGTFWKELGTRSFETHERYVPFRSLCAEVVKWRDAAVHRAAPLAILHLTTEQRDAWEPEKGAIRIVDDPDWRGAELGPKTKWIEPLGKHHTWRPQFLDLCNLTCEDWVAGS